MCGPGLLGTLRHVRAFRFSVNVFGIPSREALRERCRRAESAGFHTVFAADHLGAPAPFPVVQAAADATEHLRVGTLVLNAPFWNPALLAREAATADVLSGGRLELGLGAGHMKHEFDTAGIPWEPFGARVDRLEETITTLRRFFATDLAALPGGLSPVPVQRTGFDGSGPPLIVGGTGDRVLSVAARYADIIGVAGAFQVPGEPPGTFRLATAAEADERVRFTRERAGGRADDVEWHLLVQMVVPTTDRRAAAEELVGRLHGMSVEDTLETPYLLIGTPAQMAEQLRASRERYGFSYVTVHAPYYEAFEPVVELLRG
ncbi:TIGR03621 family F420-dependent LLM class oxidoreductase [Pseudonocardia zijingensis]|uniref:TIGR03621 family F420-dependent LLM class oxidoreductase n=1 Tax=Pseudonocardia zijingensis TaxID=153376 RepID=A0ABP4ASQ9_9PSEU